MELSVALANLKSLVFYYVLLSQGRQLLRLILIKGPVEGARELIKQLLQKVSSFMRAYVPGANAVVNAEVQKSIKSMQEKMVGPNTDKKYAALPPTGLDVSSLRSEMNKYHRMGHVDWQSGKVSGAIYHGGEELTALITEAFGVRKMESEVTSMVLNMYNAPANAGASITSGGTESILMSIKTHREWALHTKGITEPEMVVPVTIHAAFDKGADYFGVKIIHIPVEVATGKVDIAKMSRAITSNTILIAGSSPNFPHGIIDDIPALAKLAKKHNIGLHVDACLGGFLVPFMEKAGFPLPHPVDFRVDGVTSISCDTHKYGFAPKGSSVIMYRSQELRKYQYFLSTDWPGGVYASPTIAGSRPGALVAGCWTTMLRLGESGYVESTKQIISSARRIKQGIEGIKGLRVIGNPLVSVISFDAAPPLKIYGIGDLLSRKGWHLNMLQFPEAIHIACTYLTVHSADKLIEDIREAVETLRKDPSAGNGDLAAIYGTAASVPDRSIIADVARGFLDSLTML
ncbi:hypothetical protein HDU76_012650 [Blyttiomyces sp. JEL0837]|nr:hypothetical protein HDU76_012650 [Blyttiomyces sp. JEL0837]